MPKARKKSARRPARRGGAAPAREDLNKASRALLGKDEETREVRPQPEDASVEDPLRDWPEE